MAHEVETMMYRGTTPWHGLGTFCANELTIEAGLAKSGLDWQVGLEALQTIDGERVPNRAVRRMTDRKILGVVGPDYHPLQNRDAFKFFQPWIDSGVASLHTAGSLRGGKRVWVLAKINTPLGEVAEGDKVASYILLSHGHDGTLAIRVGFTPIRVVCANTLAASHKDGGSKLIKLLHTKNSGAALDNLQSVMSVATSTFEATIAQYRKLAGLRISAADLRQYVKIILDVANVNDKDLPPQTLTKIREIVRLAGQGRGNAQASVNGTLWAAYNGVTEYLCYNHGRTQDARLDSVWFGVNASTSAAALETALAMVV